MAKDFIEEGRALLARREYGEVVRVCRAGLSGAGGKSGRGRGNADDRVEDARVLLGQALAYLGRWREVLIEMDLVLAKSSRIALAWRLRGQALLGAEDYTQAEESLRRAKQLDPKDVSVDDLLAEVAVARGAAQRSYSAAELTDHSTGGTLPTMPTMPGLATLGDGKTVSDLHAHEPRTDIDIDLDMPSDPSIPNPQVHGSVPRIDPRLDADSHDRTVPIPFVDPPPEERTDIRASTRVDPLIVGHDVRPVLTPTGAGPETTAVPLPPPPAPPIAPLGDGDLYSSSAKRPSSQPRSRRWVAIVVVLAVGALAAAAWWWLRHEHWRGGDEVARRALALGKSGSYPAFTAALGALGEPGANIAIESLRARLTAESALLYGTPRRALAPEVAEAAGRGERDALDAATLVALERDDRAAAVRLAAEHEQRFHDHRSRYLAGLAALAGQRLAEAAGPLRLAANENGYGPAYLALARVEDGLGRRDAARAAWQAALALDPQLFLARVEALRAEIRWAGIDADPHLLDSLAVSGTASVGEQARARLALAELALAKQRLPDARRALADATSLAGRDDGVLAVELARALTQAGDLEAAEAQARRALEVGAPGARLLIADVVRRRGRAEESLTLLAGDNSPEARVARAEAELALGRPTAARVECDAALQQAPGMAGALIVLARIELATQKGTEAQARLERLWSVDPSGVAAALLGEQAIAAGKLADARAKIELAQKRGASAEVHLAAAQLYRAEHNLDRAETELQMAIALEPGDPRLLRERAELAGRRGDLRQAASALAKLPTRAEAFAAARAFLQLGEINEAAAQIARGGALSGLTTDGELAIRFRVLFAQGKARDVLERAHEIVDVSQRAAFRARARLALGELAEADHEIAAIDRRDPEAVYLKARLAVERGRSVSGLEPAYSAIDRQQRGELRAEAAALLGRIAFEKGSFTKAATWLDEAVDLYPGLAEAQLYLGLVAQERGDKLKAKKALAEAVRLAPQLAEPEYYLGRMLVAETPSEAKQHLERYLKLAPSGAFASDAKTLLRKL